MTSSLINVMTPISESFFGLRLGDVHQQFLQIDPNEVQYLWICYVFNLHRRMITGHAWLFTEYAVALKATANAMQSVSSLSILH